MTKYVKTVPVEAIRFDGSKEMIDKYELGHRRDYEKPWLDQTTIWTLEGEMQIVEGDWLVTGINGEHWAIKDDVFRKSYAELPVIPRDVAELIKFRGDDHYGLGNILFEATEFEQPEECANWIATHQELVARAWLDGFQVAD